MTSRHEEAFAELVRQAAPPARDPLFRLKLLERRETERYRRHRLALTALGALLVILATAAAILRPPTTDDTIAVLFVGIVMAVAGGLYAPGLLRGRGAEIGDLCIHSPARRRPLHADRRHGPASGDPAMSDKGASRLIGLLYFLFFPTAGLSYGSLMMMKGADAAATLANVESHRSFFAFATVIGVIGFIDYLVVGLLVNRLFRPVGQGAADLLLAFVAVSTPLSLAAMAKRLDVLRLIDGGHGEAQAAQVMLALDGHDSLFLLSSIFWGLWLLPFGWLILRSRQAPRVIGVLTILAGLAYLWAVTGAQALQAYADSPIVKISGMAALAVAMVGEMTLSLWLLIMGIRPEGPR